MIQPVKLHSNVSFGNNQSTQKPNIVKKFTDVLKGFNSVAYPTVGTAQGIIQGIATTTAIGVIGKNIKESEAKIPGTLKGIFKDTKNGLWNTIKKIPNLFNKSPKENLGEIVKLPKKFYKDYLKGNKSIGAIATLSGLAVLGFHILMSHFKANRANANIDHNTRQGHLQ